MEVDETTTTDDKTARLEQQRQPITALTTVAAAAATRKKIRKRSFAVAVGKLPKDDRDNDSNGSCDDGDSDDVDKDPDWDHDGLESRHEGPPPQRRRRLDRDRGSENSKSARADQVIALPEQPGYPSVPVIEEEGRLRVLFRLESTAPAAKRNKGTRSYSSKTERNMIRLFLGRALRLTEAYTEHFWKKEWCQKNLVSPAEFVIDRCYIVILTCNLLVVSHQVALKDDIKPKNLCDKMRRLVRSSCSSKGKSHPERYGAQTILEKRLRVIGFTVEEVESISKAMRLGTEPKNRYEKCLENNLTGSGVGRKFLSDYMDSQISRIISVNEREMPTNVNTTDTV